jgi:hypothetical protein
MRASVPMLMLMITLLANQQKGHTHGRRIRVLATPPCLYIPMLEHIMTSNNQN